MNKTEDYSEILKEKRKIKLEGSLYGVPIFSLKGMPDGWIAGVGKNRKASFIQLDTLNTKKEGKNGKRF